MRCQAYKRPPCKSLPAVREDTDRRASGARCKLHINTSGTTRVIHGRLRVQSTCERAAPSMSTDHEASIARASAATRPRPSPIRRHDRRTSTTTRTPPTGHGAKGTRQSIDRRHCPSASNHSKPWRHVHGPMNPAHCSILTRQRLKRRAVNRCVSAASSTAAQCATEVSGAHCGDGDCAKALIAAQMICPYVGTGSRDFGGATGDLRRPFCAQQLFLANLLPPVVEVEKFTRLQAGDARVAEGVRSTAGIRRAPPVVA
jgi:hypothetical protein